MKSKWLSRKFLAMVVGVIFTVVAMAGFEMPITEVILVDGIIMFYVLIEGIIDMIRNR